jgi:hypothetical protein
VITVSLVSRCIYLFKGGRNTDNQSQQRRNLNRIVLLPVEYWDWTVGFNQFWGMDIYMHTAVFMLLYLVDTMQRADFLIGDLPCVYEQILK